MAAEVAPEYTLQAEQAMEEDHQVLPVEQERMAEVVDFPRPVIEVDMRPGAEFAHAVYAHFSREWRARYVPTHGQFE